MAPNRALQKPRAEAAGLSTNIRTVRERDRRARLGLVQADYERQKKADTEYIRRALNVFKQSDYYLKAPNDAARQAAVEAEKARLKRDRLYGSNHHSLMPTEYKGKLKQLSTANSWKDKHAGEDEAPQMRREKEKEESLKEQLLEAQRCEQAKRIKAESLEPRIKQESMEDVDEDTPPGMAWALGNTHRQSNDYV
ncbi:Hypothetical protein D9617_2g060130 [Elsinoe fawcettii]|nr:Hypothetical protein D9617_2g060130 [Elsinoe fawcettii]